MCRFREFVSAIRVIERACLMPVLRGVLPFFVVLGGSTVGACRQFVLLGRLPV